MGRRTEAVRYAQSGWRVIPIWWVEDGRCGCGDPYCTAPGKHPLIKTGRGLSEASNDEKKVAGWWDRWPRANIAVPCGKTTGIVVIDCDIREEHDGFVEVLSWCAERGIDVPHTLTAETGSGGRHLLLRYPDDGLPIRNVQAWLEDVDVKSDGGYVLVAPSEHISGGTYRWLSATGTPPAPMPAELLAALRSAKSSPGAGKGAMGADRPAYDYRTAVREGPKSGHRDHFFNARSFELRKSGVILEDALTDLRRLWELCEQPDGDEFPWDAVLDKARRVWDAVEPDPLPDWDPFAARHDPRSDASRVKVTNEPIEDSYTDQGNAWRLIKSFGDRIRYTKAQGWFVWTGLRWEPDDLERIMEFAGKTIDQMCVDAFKMPGGESRDALLGWAQQSRSRSRIEAMVKLTLTFPDIKCRITDFDTDPWLLCCPNGVIDLRTGDLRPHTIEDMITKMSPVEYHPGTRDDRWERYLLTATGGDLELAAYLRRAAGYTLTGSTREEALFMLYGPSGSGKSTFITAMQTALGDYAMTTMPENLMHRKTSQAPKDELANMRGMRLVASVEPSEGDRFAEGLIKQMTGGDRIMGRHLYKDRFEYDPTFKLWIAANSAPRARDHALFRRIRRVPFPVKLDKSQMDLTLKEDWLKLPETPGSQAVLAWAVQGALDWDANGLGSCSVVEADTEDYHDEQDVIGLFLADVINVSGDMDDEVPMRDVYAAYQTWCLRTGERAWSQIGLTRSLKEVEQEYGFRVARGRRVTLRGVKQPETAANPWPASENL